MLIKNPISKIVENKITCFSVKYIFSCQSILSEIALNICLI